MKTPKHLFGQTQWGLATYQRCYFYYFQSCLSARFDAAISSRSFVNKIS